MTALRIWQRNMFKALARIAPGHRLRCWLLRQSDDATDQTRLSNVPRLGRGGNPPRIHPTAVVSPQAQVGEGTSIWHHAQVREGVRIGRECIVGKNVYVDFDVVIGDRVKIQNNALVYHGVTIEDGVFIGPAACLTNDRRPRAVTPDGALKSGTDWEVGTILVREGAAIGARAVILPNVTIGPWAMVAAGAVVTHDVPAHGLAVGMPARLQGYVCRCGERLEPSGGNENEDGVHMRCCACGAEHVLACDSLPDTFSRTQIFTD